MLKITQRKKKQKESSKQKNKFKISKKCGKLFERQKLFLGRNSVQGRSQLFHAAASHPSLRRKPPQSQQQKKQRQHPPLTHSAGIAVIPLRQISQTAAEGRSIYVPVLWMDLLLLLPTRSSCRLPIRTRAHARFRCQCGSIVPLAFSGKNVCICCGGGITHGRCVCSIPLYRICTPLPHRWVTARRESAIHICISIGRCFRNQLLYGLPHRYGSRSNGSCFGYTETVRTFTCIQRFLSR
ncbi:hypothetical protein ECC02_012674, partial [Trypanosoma cruzi]